jgi:hypothetical protein
MDFTEFGILIAVTVGMVEVLKRAKVSSRFLPICALIIGVALSMMAIDFTTRTVLTGLVVGLSSMGLFTGTKTTIKG